jgi:hypothetical protein
MRSDFIDMTGRRFHRLTVMSKAPDKGMWFCKCDCGKETTVDAANIRRKIYPTKSCGCLNAERTGDKSPCWKGGRYLASGYIKIKVAGHPRGDSHDRVFEHIVVVEKEIGHYLDKCFTVHHLNGIKADNRIKNLEIRLGRHGKGHSVTDTLKDLIILYGNEKLHDMIDELSEPVEALTSLLQAAKP